MASLREIGEEYARSHDLFCSRIKELRRALTAEQDISRAREIRRRIMQLTPVKNDLAELRDKCLWYYEKKGANRRE